MADTLGVAMKQGASEELAVQHKPRKPWISQDTLQLVNKRVTKANRLKSAATMMEYAELCNIVKKSTRWDKRVWKQKQCANMEQNHTDGKEREAYIVVIELTVGVKGVKDKTHRVHCLTSKMIY